MKRRWIIVGIAALAAVLVSAGVVGTMAFAQDTGDGASQTFNFYDQFRQAIAGILGISVDQYDSAVQQAQQQVLDQAVTDGWLTQDQADRMSERLAQDPSMGMWGKGHGAGRPGAGRGGWGVHLISVAAEQLGMTEADLETALRDGKTIAAVAAEKGVDTQTIIDAYVTQLTARLDQAVANGKITQEQADAALEHARTRVTEQVNAAWQDLHHGGPSGGRGPACPDSTSGENDL